MVNGKEKFNESSVVILIPKQVSVFIQTDKPVYKPGDEVLYRIIVVDSEMKPVDPKKMVHQIYDADDNLLITVEADRDVDPSSSNTEKEFVEANPPDESDTCDEDDQDAEEFQECNKKRRAKFKKEQDANNVGKKTKQTSENQIDDDLIQMKNGKAGKISGIYSYHFKLGDMTVLGEWRINVTVSQNESPTIQNFVVEEYFLPRFEVNVQTAPEVIITEGQILVKVFGNYTFDGLVNGTAELSAESFQEGDTQVYSSCVKKSMKPSYELSFVINLEKDLEIANAVYYFDVQLNVKFKETLTGQVQEKNVTVRIAKAKKFSIEIIREKQRFKPGFPYKLQISVHEFDGTIFINTAPILHVLVKYHLRAPKCTQLSEVPNLYKISEHEIKTHMKAKKRLTDILLNVPKNATMFELSVKFLEAERKLNVSRYEAGSREYLEAKLESPRR